MLSSINDVNRATLKYVCVSTIKCAPRQKKQQKPQQLLEQKDLYNDKRIDADRIDAASIHVNFKHSTLTSPTWTPI